MAGSMRFASIDLLPPQWRESACKQLGLRSARETKTKAKRQSKYGAVKVKVDGIWFDSKREARYYEGLKLRVAAGEIKRFHRQVAMDLEGGIVYLVDFLVVHLDDRLEYVDAKGVKTKVFAMKRRMVRARYGVEIVCV